MVPCALILSFCHRLPILKKRGAGVKPRFTLKTKQFKWLKGPQTGTQANNDFQALLVFLGISGKKVIYSYMKSSVLLGSYFSGKVTPQIPFKNWRDQEEARNNGRAIMKKPLKKTGANQEKKTLKTGTIQFDSLNLRPFSQVKILTRLPPKSSTLSSSSS